MQARIGWPRSRSKSYCSRFKRRWNGSIYTGLHQTPDDIVNTVIQEDPDAVMLSLLSGSHNALCPVIMEKLNKHGIDDVLMSIGGIIPDEDKPTLEKIGFSGFYGPGTELKEIVEFVRNNLKR